VSFPIFRAKQTNEVQSIFKPAKKLTHVEQLSFTANSNDKQQAATATTKNV